MIINKVMIFGEVLWDIFPDGTRTLGGAPFNVAWHLQAFGVQPCLVSRIGQDPLGEEIQAKMTAWGMTTTDIQVDAEHPTGMVSITLHQGNAQYEIQPNCAYDFITFPKSPVGSDAFMLYHGSLALRNGVSRNSCDRLRQAAKQVIFDVNLRTPWWTKESIYQSLKNIDYLKLNDEELALLQANHQDHALTIREWLKSPSLKQVLVTAGEAGANLYQKNGDRHQIAPKASTPVIDTVGAGDGFCSVFMLGLLLGWPPDVTLARAQSFASAIVGIQGAISQDLDFYNAFRQAWQI